MKPPSKPSGKILLTMALNLKVDLKPDEWSLWSRPLVLIQETAHYTIDFQAILTDSNVVLNIIITGAERK